MKKLLVAGVLAAAVSVAPAYAQQPFRTAAPTTLTEQDIAKYAANADDASKLRDAVKSGQRIVVMSQADLDKMKAGQAGTIQWTIIAILVGIGIAVAFMD
jgi:hypothetical protein